MFDPVVKARRGAERETLVDALSEDSTSAIEKYQDLYVGDRSLWALARYEYLIFALSGMSGALGLWLRKTFYRSLLGRIGRGTAIGAHVTLRCPGNICLGDHNFIDGHAVLDAKGAQSGLRLGDAVLIGHGTVLSCAEARISVGDDVSIGPHCTVRAGLCPIHVGSHVTIGAHTAIISGSPSYDRMDSP